MSRIDLHTHSTVSDGTDTPGELMRKAADANLDVVALTDHDSTDGWAEAAIVAETVGITLVPGMELTTMLNGQVVHILGYLFDPDFGPLAAEIARIRNERLTRAERMVERISDQFDLSWDDVLRQTADGTTVGRPHIADALIERGYFPDRPAAFKTVLSSDSPFYVAHYAPDPITGIQLIRDAGGVPILAHPAGAHRTPLIDPPLITTLATAGLAGFEADHRENTDAGKKVLRREARVHDLVLTGASDYHGAGKPNQLGENLTSISALERIISEGTVLPLFA